MCYIQTDRHSWGGLARERKADRRQAEQTVDKKQKAERRGECYSEAGEGKALLLLDPTTSLADGRKAKSIIKIAGNTIEFRLLSCHSSKPKP